MEVKMLEKVQYKIGEFDKLNNFNKARILGMADRKRQEYNAEQAILECFGSYKKYMEIVCICGNIGVAKDRSREDDYPFAPFVKGQNGWKRCGSIHHNEESAMLYGLGYYYDGINSRFGSFAERMLNNLQQPT
jgi:hypothetical protein